MRFLLAVEIDINDGEHPSAVAAHPPAQNGFSHDQRGKKRR
jgi:hypothetical protein